MRASSLFKETLLSVGSRPWRALLIAFAIGGINFGAAAPDMVLGHQTVKSIEIGQEQGANAFVATSADGRLRSGECLALQNNPAVLAVGALISKSVRATTLAPRNPFRVAYVTPGYLNVLAPATTPYRAGLYFGAAVARELPHATGQPVVLNDGVKSTLGGVLAETTRDDDQSRWIYVVGSSTDSVNECWVEARAGFAAQVRAIVPSALASSKRLSIRSLHHDNQEAIQEAWIARPTQYSGMIGGILAGVLLSLAITRRSERALLTILGFKRHQVIVMIVLEQSLLVICALAISWSALSAAAVWFHLDPVLSARLALTQCSEAFGITAICGVLAACASQFGDASVLVRNRD
jgi:hypothetical protein